MRTTNGEGTALQLVKLVADTFPTFQDETVYDGQRGDSLIHVQPARRSQSSVSLPLETRANPRCRNLGSLLPSLAR